MAGQSLKPVNTVPGPGVPQPGKPALMSDITPLSVNLPLKFQSTGLPAVANPGPSLIPIPTGP